jgi:hypothetical protein
MKKLLIFATLSEGSAGLVLLVYPPIVIRLLFGEEITGAGILMSRIAAITLIALSVACWPGSNTLRAFYGILTYSAIVMLYLVFVAIAHEAGILLWPAVAVHAGISVLLCMAWWKERKSDGGIGQRSLA